MPSKTLRVQNRRLFTALTKLPRYEYCMPWGSWKPPRKWVSLLFGVISFISPDFGARQKNAFQDPTAPVVVGRTGKDQRGYENTLWSESIHEELEGVPFPCLDAGCSTTARPALRSDLRAWSSPVTSPEGRHQPGREWWILNQSTTRGL